MYFTYEVMEISIPRSRYEKEICFDKNELYIKRFSQVYLMFHLVVQLLIEYR